MVVDVCMYWKKQRRMKNQTEKRFEDPNIWSSKITSAMATGVSISGCTTRRNTSTPRATPATASFRFISATHLRVSSYTAQHRWEYDPSISYIAFLGLLLLLLLPPAPPPPLTRANDFEFSRLACFLTWNRGFSAVSPSYTIQLSPKLSLCNQNQNQRINPWKKTTKASITTSKPCGGWWEEACRRRPWGQSRPYVPQHNCRP